jgi:hypothetical protein
MVIDANITRDESTYQFHMPASLEEVFLSDTEAVALARIASGPTKKRGASIAKVK